MFELEIISRMGNCQLLQCKICCVSGSTVQMVMLLRTSNPNRHAHICMYHVTLTYALSDCLHTCFSLSCSGRHHACSVLRPWAPRNLRP